MIAMSLKLPAVSAAWRAPGVALLAVLVAVLVLYFQTGSAMVSIWLRSDTYAHAFVVPPIVLWLIWRRRDMLQALSPKPAPWALLPMAGAALAWLVGSVVSANSVSQFAFTAMLVLTVPLVLGWQVAWALAFPLVFLFFAVPVGEFLTPMMMQGTADFTVLALRASGIPVYREGLQFVIPSGNWSVVEACSGVRYLIASFMVGSLFAYLNYRSTKRRLIFVAVAIALPIVANWLRAYLIVMLAHFSNNEIATGADHLVYGWVFFGIVIMGMFFIGARWSEPDAQDLPSAALSLATPAASGSAWAVAAAAMLVVASPVAYFSHMAGSAAAAAPIRALPNVLGQAWASTASPVSDWRPAFVEPAAELSQTYAAGATSVGVYIAYYRQQNETRKLVSSRNVLVRSEDPHWNQLSSGTRIASTQAGDVAVRSAELLAATASGQPVRQRLQVWQLYWVGGRFTTSDVVAKLLGAWQRLSGQGDDSAILVFYTDQPSPEVAAPLLAAFLDANLRILEATLQASRASR